jgi:hypothetical protein
MWEHATEYLRKNKEHFLECILHPCTAVPLDGMLLALL